MRNWIGRCNIVRNKEGNCEAVWAYTSLSKQDNTSTSSPFSSKDNVLYMYLKLHKLAQDNNLPPTTAMRFALSDYKHGWMLQQCLSIVYYKLYNFQQHISCHGRRNDDKLCNTSYMEQRISNCFESLNEQSPYGISWHFTFSHLCISYCFPSYYVIYAFDAQ